MGILDDAIRQHLDLKRRLGAGEDELQRLEDEAFGPPSRPGDPDFPSPHPEGTVPAGSETEAITGAEATAVEEPPVQALAPEPVEEPVPGLAPEPEPMPRDPEPDLHSPEPAPAADEPPEQPIESLDTVEHHFEGAIEETGESDAVGGEEVELVEGEVEEPGPESGEDVLEETPEFLRDAPEDDELWFEQGEPKDFDF